MSQISTLHFFLDEKELLVVFGINKNTKYETFESLNKLLYPSWDMKIRNLRMNQVAKEVFKEAGDVIIDLAEAKHIEAIREGYYPAILFHLKTKGLKRGYSATDPLPIDENNRGFILKIEEAKRPSAPSEALKIYEQVMKEN